MRASLVVVLGLFACGGGGGGGDNPDGSTGGDVGEPGWTKLITRTWTMIPGQEGYRCRRVQVPEDMWISGFRTLSPQGTHHTVVTIDPNGSMTGDFNCSVATGTLSGQMMYASGVGTDDLMFPSGVAVRLAKGSWINLNLHLFDTTDQPLANESGVLVKTIAATEVVHPADMTFAGTMQLGVIPSDNQPHTFTGGCNAPTDWHVFALWPHMHQAATHQKFAINGNAMLDQPFAFAEQKNYPMAETVIRAGDRIDVSCTYVNNTGSGITWGDSSNQEMCFTGLYKWPAGGSPLTCVDK